MNRRELKKNARQCVREAAYSPKKVTLAALVAALVLVLIAWGGNYLADHMTVSRQYLSQSISSGGQSFLVSVVVGLIFQFGLVFLAAGYGAFALRIHRKQSFSLGILWEGTRRWAKCALLYIWISIWLAIWACILSIPVSYVLSVFYLAGMLDENALMAALLVCMEILMFVMSYRYRMAWFILMDQPELSVRQIVNRAKTINRYHRVQTFVMDLSFLPWILLCILTCGILCIWKLPYIITSYAGAYDAMAADYQRRRERLEHIMHERQSNIRMHF